ncbi:hypothetical protein HCN51_27040 [Nonomuraea sp. FMUSA5-5]|uniref:Uncharacterized protein n=1 Tax=Nonomuraea composti TaxID=2720023 RepID=A0ABX1BBA4_9ACTN|nr:hypothetical protein [Nonomuraea sp. FMUSA5-5]NJP93061.1 hypothetical protein [Nonomuraea sp. FMUSA5-5]
MVDGVPGTFGLDGPVVQFATEQIVIDRGTGRLLGKQGLTPEGAAWRAGIVRSTGWSDVRPVSPAGCVRCTARL